MKLHQRIGDVFDANRAIHQQLVETVRTIVDPPTRNDAEGWNVAQILEHLALVNDGSYRICNKLMTAAAEAGKLSDGTLHYSGGFFESGVGLSQVKLEAPERVQPVNGAAVEESLAKLIGTDEKFETLRPLFEKYDCRDQTFPHPYFGPLSAVEWLALTGEHMARHTTQIERLIGG